MKWCNKKSLYSLCDGFDLVLTTLHPFGASVKATPDGIQAILRLSGGDMRKCLNILQSTHMAYPEVNEESVYLCTGNPLPSDIQAMLNSMLNEPFADAHAGVIWEVFFFSSLSLTQLS